MTEIYWVGRSWDNNAFYGHRRSEAQPNLKWTQTFGLYKGTVSGVWQAVYAEAPKQPGRPLGLPDRLEFLGIAMGVNIADLQLLLKLRQAGSIGSRGTVVELGAQQLANDIPADGELLERIQHAFEIAAPFRWTQSAVRRSGEAGGNRPLAREFWEWLGFSYAAIDIDNTPRNIALDLNYDDVPENLRKSFDIVTNYGTTEHVANQLNAFKIIHDLTRVGGVMLHHIPAQGYSNHGLVNYNPKFFWMLCRSNRYGFMYMAYSGDRKLCYALPDDIMSFLKEFDSDRDNQASQLRIADMSLVFALRKDFDQAFVSPLDVPTGTRPASDEMRSRYWTVFEDGAF